MTEKTGWEERRSYPGIAVGDPKILERLMVWRVLRRTDVDRSWIVVRGEADVCATLAVRRMNGAMDNLMLMLEVWLFAMNVSEIQFLFTLSS